MKLVNEDMKNQKLSVGAKMLLQVDANGCVEVEDKDVAKSLMTYAGFKSLKKEDFETKKTTTRKVVDNFKQVEVPVEAKAPVEVVADATVDATVEAKTETPKTFERKWLPGKNNKNK